MSIFQVGDKVVLANAEEVGTGGFADQAGMKPDVPMEVSDTGQFGVKLAGYPHPAVEWWTDGRFVLAPTPTPEPKFKPGDKVLRTGETIDDVVQGQVYTVHAYNPYADWAELQLEEPARAWADTSNIYRNWAARNFEKFAEPVQETASDFKVGDRVTLAVPLGRHSAGEDAEVTELRGPDGFSALNYRITVNPGTRFSDSGWWVRNDEIVAVEPMPEPVAHTKFKAGNSVYYNDIPGLDSGPGTGVIEKIEWYENDGKQKHVYRVRVGDDDFEGVWSFGDDDLSLEEPVKEPSLTALLLEVEVRIADLDENVQTEKVAKAEALRYLIRILGDNI